VKKVYIASGSRVRHMLLEQARIPFSVVSHLSAEDFVYQSSMTVSDYVTLITADKMKHACLPSLAANEDELYLLTADTLAYATASGRILAKPRDRDEARLMLNLYKKEPIVVATAFCLEKREKKENSWLTVYSHTECITSNVEFHVDEELIDHYLDTVPHALASSGAGVIEGYGFTFLKKIEGSYTAILGLPLFELHQALKKSDFFTIR
jgi:septum formation protein